MRAIPAPGRAGGNCDAGRVIDATVRIIRRDVERVAALEVVLDQAPLVRVESSALGQIVLNLVLNAAQAIEGSGMSGGSIRLVVDATADMAVVSVTDNGPGIERQNLDRIFEPYFTTKSTGTGLGLSIVREMVRRAGGEISARSIAGPGDALRGAPAAGRSALSGPRGSSVRAHRQGSFDFFDQSRRVDRLREKSRGAQLRRADRGFSRNWLP